VAKARTCVGSDPQRSRCGWSMQGSPKGGCASALPVSARWEFDDTRFAALSSLGPWAKHAASVDVYAARSNAHFAWEIAARDGLREHVPGPVTGQHAA
jgi:hypothetical protein